MKYVNFVIDTEAVVSFLANGAYESTIEGYLYCRYCGEGSKRPHKDDCLYKTVVNSVTYDEPGQESESDD